MRLEHLVPGDWESAQRNFQKLGQNVPDTGGVSARMRFGSNTTTYPGGSTFSNTKSISHGLGKNPSSVLVTPFGTRWTTVNLMSIDDTQFTVQFQVNDTGVNPAAGTGQSFSWQVLG